MDSAPFTPEFFDPQQEALVVWRKLPHWSQAGVLCFITFRTFDSIPAKVVAAWHAQRDEWLRGHGFDPSSRTWNTSLRESPQLWAEFHKRFSNRWHDNLDACHGECVLRRPELALIVEKSLMHFDGDRYLLTDFVVMPNHVHILVAIPNEEVMLSQCESWKHYTATQINRRLGRSGRFWQQDGFDHLVRNDHQYHCLKQYLADNPRKANLNPGEYIHYSVK